MISLVVPHAASENDYANIAKFVIQLNNIVTDFVVSNYVQILMIVIVPIF